MIMNDNKKTSQLNIRIANRQKDEITKIANNAGYKSISKFLIDNALNELKIKPKDNRGIYVVSLSSAIDYFIKTIEIGENKTGKNKFYKEDKVFVPGGRGINLSRILNTYNIRNTNINISGGFTGKKLSKLLEEYGVSQYWIESDYDTKINIYAEDSNGKDISLEEKTSTISTYAKEELKKFLWARTKPEDEVVLSGSFTKEDVPYIKDLLSSLNSNDIKIYLNSSSVFVKDIIRNINPEFIVLCMRNFHGDVKSKKQIINQMEEFRQMGCKNVAFVADVNNSLFINDEGVFEISSNLIDKLTYSGLEDAFVAGYMANVNQDIEERLRWAEASVRAKVDGIETIHFDQIVKFLSEINVKRIE